MKKRYVLKNKNRFTLFIIFALTVIFTLAFASNAYGFKDVSYELIEVDSGDTLWNIAEKYGTDKDVRETIYEIKKLNNLSGSEIYQGSILKIPVM